MAHSPRPTYPLVDSKISAFGKRSSARAPLLASLFTGCSLLFTQATVATTHMAAATTQVAAASSAEIPVVATTQAVSQTAQQAIDFAALGQALQSSLSEQQIPGAQVAIYNSQQMLWQQNFGLANVAGNSAVTDDTRFRAGSTTKTLIALAIMQLVKQGKLALTDQVQRWLPELAIVNPWANSHPVTVLHLLEHSAGLDDMHFRNLYNIDQPGISLVAALNRDSQALVVRWQPGSRHAYSNPGYGILGALIERISGETLEHYVAAQLLAPLGMTRSYLTTDLTAEPALAEGYANLQPQPFRQIYLRSAGNLHSTAADLAKLGQWLLSQGHSATLAQLDGAAIVDMETPQSTLAAQHGLSYGYGKAIYQRTLEQQVWFGHDGGIDGFITAYAYNRERDIGFAVMINSSSSSMRKLTKIIASHIAPATVSTEPASHGVAIPADLAAKLQGYYRVANERNQLFAGLGYAFAVVKASVQDDVLTLSPVLNANIQFRHLGDGRFSKIDQTPATGIALTETGTGTALNLDGDYFEQISVVSFYSGVSIIIAALIAFAIMALYLPVWLVNLLRGKIVGTPQILLRALPSIALLSMVASIVAISQMNLYAAGHFNWQTLTVTISTLLLALSSVASLLSLVRYHALETSTLRKLLLAFVSVSLCLFTLYCAQFNYIGIMLWQW